MNTDQPKNVSRTKTILLSGLIGAFALALGKVVGGLLFSSPLEARDIFRDIFTGGLSGFTAGCIIGWLKPNWRPKKD